MSHARLLLALLVAGAIAVGWSTRPAARCAGCCAASTKGRAEARGDATGVGSSLSVSAIYRHRPARSVAQLLWSDGVPAGTAPVDGDWFPFTAGARPLAQAASFGKWQFVYGAGVGVVVAMRQQGALEFRSRGPAAEEDEAWLANRPEPDFSAANLPSAEPEPRDDRWCSRRRYRF